MGKKEKWYELDYFPIVDNYNIYSGEAMAGNQRIDEKVIDMILEKYHKEFSYQDKSALSARDKREHLEIIIGKYLPSFGKKEKRNLVDAAYNKILAYWFLQVYIRDKDVYEIKIFEWDAIYIYQVIDNKEVVKILERDKCFPSKEEYIKFFNKVTRRLGAIVNDNNAMPMAADKVNKVRVAFNFNSERDIHQLTFRCHGNLGGKDAILKGKMMTEPQFNTILNKIREGKSIVISGGVGSGKTTLCRALLESLGEEKVIVVVEEFEELYLEKLGVKAVYRYKYAAEDDKENVGNSLNVITHKLLTIKHDIFYFSELRDNDVLPFFKMIGTGSAGLSTIHSHNARGALENVILRADSAEGVKTESIQQKINSALDYIIHLDRFTLKEVYNVSSGSNESI